MTLYFYGPPTPLPLVSELMRQMENQKCEVVAVTQVGMATPRISLSPQKEAVPAFIVWFRKPVQTLDYRRERGNGDTILLDYDLMPDNEKWHMQGSIKLEVPDE